MSKEKKAIEALIEWEIMSDYACKFEVKHVEGDDYEVWFDDTYNFNDLTIRVDKLDESDPISSDFSINVYDDTYHEFSCCNHTVAELWKALLWKGRE